MLGLFFALGAKLVSLCQSEAAMLRTELEDNKLLSSERWQSLLELKPLIRRPAQTVSLMTRYSLERSLTSLCLIDWALNHCGLRGLQGLAWSDRTREQE